MLQEIFNDFIVGLKNTTVLEYIAVITGIVSVWFSKKENILVYPVGLVNTTIFVYLSFKYHLIGEAAVNFYYTVLSIWGWYLWAKKDVSAKPILHITFSNKKELLQQALFFLSLYLIIFFSLTYLKASFLRGGYTMGRCICIGNSVYRHVVNG